MPHNVAPGQSVLVDVTVYSLPPGAYTIRFDMDHYGITWFHWHGSPQSQPVYFTVPNETPVVDSMAPLSGYAADTLTPTFRITGHDSDNYPGNGLAYLFQVCDGTGDLLQNCFDSCWIGQDTWRPPSGQLRWGKQYVWRASVTLPGGRNHIAPELPRKRLRHSSILPARTTTLTGQESTKPWAAPSR